MLPGSTRRTNLCLGISLFLPLIGIALLLKWPNVATVLLQVPLQAGAYVLMVLGCAYYGAGKGYGPALGLMLGFLWLPGLIALVVLPDKHPGEDLDAGLLSTRVIASAYLLAIFGGLALLFGPYARISWKLHQMQRDLRNMQIVVNQRAAERAIQILKQEPDIILNSRNPVGVRALGIGLLLESSPEGFGKGSTVLASLEARPSASEDDLEIARRLKTALALITDAKAFRFKPITATGFGICSNSDGTKGFNSTSAAEFKSHKQGECLDLSGVDLGGLSLSGANLRGSRLANASFKRADLSYARLDSADLRGADLSAADLRYARLFGAKLDGANLQGAKILSTSLPFSIAEVVRRGAVPIGANQAPEPSETGNRLAMGEGRYRCQDERGTEGWNRITVEELLRTKSAECAELSSMQLPKAELAGANLRGARLSIAPRFQRIEIKAAPGSKIGLPPPRMMPPSLAGADLERADLSDSQMPLLVDFSQANLRMAKLARATIGVNTRFNGADLSGVDMAGATLMAILSGANLRGAYWLATDIRLVSADGKTTFPYGMDDAKRRGVNFEPSVSPVALRRLKIRRDAGLFNYQLENWKGVCRNAKNKDGINKLEATQLRKWKDGECSDLRGADLSGANLAKAELQKADLRGAKLVAAVLNGAKLRDADLSGANLAGANLGEAMLQYASLAGAFLGKARLGGARLWKADLSRARLEGADLDKSDLSFADLRGADLRHASANRAYLSLARADGSTRFPFSHEEAIRRGVIFDEPKAGTFRLIPRPGYVACIDQTGTYGTNDAVGLTRGDGQCADLMGADLHSARLGGADLQGANLTEAHLANADLHGARLDWADLYRADFRGADLTGATLTHAILQDALADGDTRWPFKASEAKRRGVRFP